MVFSALLADERKQCFTIPTKGFFCCQFERVKAGVIYVIESRCVCTNKLSNYNRVVVELLDTEFLWALSERLKRSVM